MHGRDLEAGAGDEVGELLGGEAAGERVAGAPAPGGVGEGLARLGEVPGEGAGEHGAAESGGEQAEGAGGAEGGDRVADALGRVLDVLEHAVTEHDVEAVALDDVEQAVRVALDAPDAVGDAGLGGPALQREQRVGAGVDDGDPVAEPGERHRELARAATGVEHLEDVPTGGLDPAVEGVPQDLPDDGGAEGSPGAQGVGHGEWLLGDD